MGLEPATGQGLSVDKSSNCTNSDNAMSAPTSAVGAENGRSSRIPDPDLRHIVDAWERLPGVVRAGIVAMVKSAVGTGGGL